MIIILNTRIIKPHPVNDMDQYHLFLGFIYDTDKRQFISFRADLSNAEVGMLYKGDILIGEIFENCLIPKPLHSSSISTDEEIELLMSDSSISDMVKPYLREEKLKGLGI